MTMVDIGVMPWPSPPTGSLPSFASILLDAADEAAASIIRIPRAGTIVRGHFRTGTVTTGGTGDIDIRAETVSNGQATGTLFGANTNINHDLTDGDDNTWIRSAAFTSSFAVALGDQVALAVVNPSSNFGNFNVVTSSMTSLIVSPGVSHAFGPTRATKIDLAAPIMALEYDDGSFAIPAGCFPMHTAATALALTTSSNPDEAALYFTALAKMRVVGWWMAAALNAGADYRVNLYENGNDTPLLSADYDGDHTSSTGSRTYVELFDDAYTLTAGTVYRLGFLATTANQVALRYWEVSSSYLNLLDCVSGKKTTYYSARNRSGTSDPDAAAWSETTNRRLIAGLLVDQIDDGTGGGGSTTIFSPFKGPIG
jgi:hypothetical protein